MLRHLATFQTCTLRAARSINQRRWAQVHDVRFLATTQESRSVLEKYRDKLDRKAREEGLPDIDALKKAYSDKIESIKKRADAEDPLIAAGLEKAAAAASSPITSTTPPTTPPTQSKQPSSSSSSTGVKPLSSILDIPKVRVLPERELTAIWRLRHAEKPQSICAVIPNANYSAISAAAHAYPQFVLPVPHPDQGAELHFIQWTFDASTKTSTVLFTQLAEYKNRGEFAQPHTTVTHYEDLAEESESRVVLMHGQVMENRGVSIADAQWLVLSLGRFYGGWDGVGGAAGKERAEERRRLLEWFSRGDERFTVER